MLLACLTGWLGVQAQVPARKIDTTMKVGKFGYRINCSNKSAESNVLSVKPMGFEKEVTDFSVEVRGRVPNAEVDDINRDGFPDLLLYVHLPDSLDRVNVFCIVTEGNASVAPVILPDIYDDPKNRVGYKGHDSFFLMEGYLVRRFPVYPADGAPAPANGGTLYRQIQYNVVKEERGYRFRVLRSYEFTR